MAGANKSNRLDFPYFNDDTDAQTKCIFKLNGWWCSLIRARVPGSDQEEYIQIACTSFGDLLDLRLHYLILYRVKCLRGG